MQASKLNPPRRRGVTIIEVTVAAAMLGVLLASSAQVMRSLAAQQAAAARRATALQLLQAVMEEFANQPWDELTPEFASQVALPDVANSLLPGATVKATVTGDSNPIAAKRLAVELRWNSPNGQPASPLRLTTWVYAAASTAEDAP